MSKGLRLAAQLLILLALSVLPAVAPVLAVDPTTVAGGKTTAATNTVVGQKTLLCTQPPVNSDLGVVLEFYLCVVTRYTTALAVLIVMVVGVMYVIGAFKADQVNIAKSNLLTTITGLLFMYMTSFIIGLLVETNIVTKS